ncbi:MAG: hypothetical protein N2748_06180 [candidate division WOR-3 bacterium]|nr:hypothetical protein [candidate division WOR-3 bacterium]
MKLLAINVEIGLGHPGYLDNVLQALKQIQPNIKIDYWDVLTNEKLITKLFWKISKQIYHIGGFGGLFSDFYNKLRQKPITPNLPLCNISTAQYDKILVAHPLLARYLDLDKVWYIHGEIGVPIECQVKNVGKIIVPVIEAKEKFVALGIKPEKVYVSGLIVSPDLIADAEANYQKRLSRLQSKRIFTVGFFISGAYPKPHIQKIILSINSITVKGHRAIVFLGIDAKRGKRFITELNRIKNANVSTSILFIQGKNRQEYQRRICRLLPLLDFFVAPSHEYTNWAIGLGMPMFSLFPMIGSYASENYQFAYNLGVTYPIQTEDDAQSLANIIQQLSESGELVKMAEKGFSKFAIDGAIKTALQILKC